MSSTVKNCRAITLFTVSFSHLHYNVIQRERQTISCQNYKIARNCLTYMLDFIVMQMIRDSLSWWIRPLFSKMEFTGLSRVTFFVLFLFFLTSHTVFCLGLGSNDRRLCTPVQAGMTVPSNFEVQWKLAMRVWVGLNPMTGLNLNRWKVITTYQRNVDKIKKKNQIWISVWKLPFVSRIPLVADPACCLSRSSPARVFRRVPTDRAWSRLHNGKMSIQLVFGWPNKQLIQRGISAYTWWVFRI